jgi:hypothetical protein
MRDSRRPEPDGHLQRRLAAQGGTQREHQADTGREDRQYF